MHTTRSLLICAGAAFFVSTLAGCAAPGHRAAFDPDRNIFIPEAQDLVSTLRVSAVHDAEHIQIRYEFPTDNPSWYHQYWVYENGSWTRYGSSPAGPEPHGFYEDRISVAIDAGNIPHYDIYGGFLVTHPGVRSRTDEVSREHAEAHPHIGQRLGESDVRKFVSESRTDGPLDTRWSSVRDPAELMDLRRRSVFLDTWQWRAHRSNPVGFADNGYVLDYRLSSEGRSMYTTNANNNGDGPAFVFNEQAAGVRALSKSRLLERGYSQDDPYYLTEETARPISDRDRWNEGDAIPYRLLREPSGSRGSIKADGRWEDGVWRVRVTRTLEAPNRLDSHDLVPGWDYTVQFAIHSGAVGARWHLVSAPISMRVGDGGSDAGATLVASRAPDGTDLNDAESVWIELPVFYPGQAGADEIRADPELDAAVRAVAADPKDDQKVRRLSELLAAREPVRR
ncbi:MAG: hypothetical protein JJU33_03155 [Phycisphaerales bacterium]|nr:hypothetical protein [Phycisphaerales bacterium]